MSRRNALRGMNPAPPDDVEPGANPYKYTNKINEFESTSEKFDTGEMQSEAVKPEEPQGLFDTQSSDNFNLFDSDDFSNEEGEETSDFDYEEPQRPADSLNVKVRKSERKTEEREAKTQRRRKPGPKSKAPEPEYEEPEYEDEVEETVEDENPWGATEPSYSEPEAPIFGLNDSSDEGEFEDREAEGRLKDSSAGSSSHERADYIPAVWNRAEDEPKKLPDVRDYMIDSISRIVMKDAYENHDSQTLTAAFKGKIIEEYLNHNIKNEQMFVHLIQELILTKFETEIFGKDTINILNYLKETRGK